MSLTDNQVKDQNLMEAYTKYMNNKEDLKRINTRRQFTKVLHLLDITTADRSNIDHIYYNDRRNNSSLKWVNLPDLPKKSRVTWKRQ